jgi:hypothetical protein
MVIVVGIQLGRSIANLLAGAGWTWPTAAENTSGFQTGSPISTAFWTSLPGVLGGDSAAGLTSPTTVRLAGPGLLAGSITVTELALITVTAWAGVWLYLRWGPGRMRGMATVAEAEKLLGITRLRKVAPIVRPDLYGRHAHHRQDLPPIRRAAGDDTAAREGTAIGRGLSTPWLRTNRRTKEEQ